MKQLFGLFTILIILIDHGASSACSIENPKRTLVGRNEAVTGTCSNNRLPIICQYVDGPEINCDGPGGSFTGYELENLIFSACGCSIQEEKAEQQKKEFDRLR